MHCPRCGADAINEQQFCRSCGFNLEKVATLLAEQPHSTDKNVARLQERQRKIERWTGIAGIATFELILLTLLYVVAHQMILKPGMIVPAVLLTVLAMGVNVMVVLQLYAKSLKRELNRPRTLTIEPSTLSPGQVPVMKPAASVTDRTTELLAAPTKVDIGEMKTFNS